MTIPTPTPATIRPRPATAQAAKPAGRHRRGDVWMVVADPTAPAVGTELWSNRPAVVVSNNVLNARSGFAQVIYLSTATRKRTGPTHVEVPAAEGGGTAMALCEQIHTVDASRLRRRMNVLPDESMREIDEAMTLSLSIGRNPNTHGAFRKWEEHIKVHGVDMAEEIAALSGNTTDERVEALTRALTLMTVERDAFRDLYLGMPSTAAALEDLSAVLSGASNS